MRAAVLHRPGPVDGAPLRVGEVDVPDPGPGELRVRVEACAVCRTDLQLCEGDLAARRLPIVPGHQIVGTVDALGPGVDDDRLGERCGIGWIAGSCGRCRFCVTGRENLCLSASFTGWDRDGGFAEQVVADARYVAPLPDVDPTAIAPLLCGGAIGYRCLRVAEVVAGSRLGLYGFGSSATSVIQIARHWGCEVFVCTRSPDEQARARRMGAVWAGGYDESPPAPLDAAITFAPVGSVVVDALRAVDRGGVVAVNAIHLDQVPAFPYELLWWERQLRSVANVTRHDIAELLRLAVEIPIRSEIEVHPLDAANDALRRLRRGDVSGSAVLRV